MMATGLPARGNGRLQDAGNDVDAEAIAGPLAMACREGREYKNEER
jgi:hypothetical protein